MRSLHASSSFRAEEGAVAVITAILLTVLLLSAAIVLDIAGLRADRVQSKSVADMAAAASVASYDPEGPTGAEQACLDAIDFAAANLDDEEALAETNRSCSQIYSGYACDPLVAPSPAATYRIGDRIVEVLIPVPDAHPLMEQLSHGAAFDGTPCERVGVQISRDRDFLLARVAGFDGATTLQGSVGVTTIAGRDLEFASLIVLQRQGCQTLENSGGGVLRVLNLERWEDKDGNVVPEGSPGGTKKVYNGTITTDTVPGPGCGGQRKIIETSNNATTFAEGNIFAHSLVTADAGNTWTYNPAHVNSGALSPRPRPGPEITRALIDHKFNCLPGGYTDSGPLWSPLRGQQPIGVCAPTNAKGEPITPPPPYLKLLDDAVQATMSEFEGGTVPTGWSVFPDPAEGETCSDDSVTITGGRWIVDCPEDLRPRGLSFVNVEHIIFAQGVELGTNADVMEIEALSGSAGTTVTMYQNGLELGGGELTMRNAFVYIRSAATNSTAGRIDVSGSTNRFALQAPLPAELDTSACSSFGSGPGMPPAVCFGPLAVWSNYVGSGTGNRQNAVSGNAAGGIIGTVFTPNSTFRFRGSGDEEVQFCGQQTWDLISNTSATLELAGAQFFTSRVDVAGTAEVGMCPSPDTTIGVPIRGSRLIR